MFSKALCHFIESSKSVFHLGGFSWVKFATERRILCVPWTSARNQLRLSPLHMKIPTPGRAAYMPHILRPCKHNVLKFGVCLFVWLVFSNRNDRALHYNYLLLLLISHLPKQSLALTLERNLSPVAVETDEFEAAEGVSVQSLQTMQCWARNADVWQHMAMQQAHVVSSAFWEASVCVQGRECAAMLGYSSIQG